ncbi:hypothetical protein PHYSODRAFT_306248 [Phytophthora sojae]|uniref:Uncharacterized protein n=1 Tax=Phytophthora sojae (strain P6497) TaxID=1094619 RepID=G5A8L6_PHYSP|nr:hypothetical protein PHYSODRAFT_306248 [Phytophthora sojae]EGZ08242.1 hypothetical protein PHYSODRAFT_306248 [Phytophthora sojae]|eukprot:XP_009536414.1 hypothetical protein PHYSODRAFT_306248 [Phytophthora sojae]
MSIERRRIQRSDLVFAESTEEEPSASVVPSLHIRLEKFDPYEADGLPQFIAVVGPPLKFLALNDARGEIDENWIIRSCPNLEEIAMYGGYGVDMRLNFSEHHANGLPLPDLTCDWHDVAALPTQFGDSNNPLAKCARRMRVRLVYLLNAWMLPDRQDFDNLLSGLLRMLEANQTLEYLDIITPPIKRALILPLESKLAFLSVLTPRHMTTKASKTRKRRALQTIRGYYQLDQHVLSKFLQFAAPRLLREVYLHGSHDDGPTGELFDIPI